MTEPRHRGTARAVALTLALSLSAVPAWVDGLSAQPPGGPAPATTVFAVLYGLASVLAVPLVGEARTRTRAGVCAVLLALGAALVVLLGPGHSWALLYGLAVVAVLLPPVAAGAITGVALAALAGFATVSGDLGEQVDDLLLLASVTAAVGLVVRLADANAELRHARDRVAQLAVLGERDRVSRDLHDVLGHSLTAITMKAGVARLLLEGGHDADGAASEVRAVEGLSRQALQDVRATVQGYREVTLDGELVVAREALRSAGIAADLPHAVDDVRPGLHPVFGYVLREATTNVLRHAGATSVRVRLGPTWIDVRDDGAEAGVGAPGNGLRGLEERVRGMGGRLEAGPVPSGGFRVRASVP